MSALIAQVRGKFRVHVVAQMRKIPAKEMCGCAQCVLALDVFEAVVEEQSYINFAT